MLWLDKVCIDQTNIVADLECLPIFLAGCNKLLIIAGSTYATRLWCVFELFVYMYMLSQSGDDGCDVDMMIIGSPDEECQKVWSAWHSFSAADCQCFDQRDKHRILQVISDNSGSVHMFDREVVAMVNAHLANTCTLHQRVCLPVRSETLNEHLHVPNEEASVLKTSDDKRDAIGHLLPPVTNEDFIEHDGPSPSTIGRIRFFGRWQCL